MLSLAYESEFEQLIASAASASDQQTALVPFWPLIGANYDHELLVIGRSVNGWVQDWTAAQLMNSSERANAVAWMRADAEPVHGDRMAWVTDLWGARQGYNTARSAFWRVIRRIISGDGPVDMNWSSRLVWTNLYKLSPAAGWNPGGDLQRAQRGRAVQLLARELEELSPKRVLALTGSWIAPFGAELELRLEARRGLVEGLGRRRGAAWVVAKHPMGKPGSAFVYAVLAGYTELGMALTPRLESKP